nr:MAG: hypothetical protein CM15mV30_1930 [uncultured marine virus]
MIAGEMHEHRIQPAMSECLKVKECRKTIKRSGNVQYKCIKTEAEIETDKLGNVHIKKLITESKMQK